MISYIRILIRKDNKEVIFCSSSDTPLKDVTRTVMHDMDDDGDPTILVDVVEWNAVYNGDKIIPARILLNSMEKFVSDLNKAPAFIGNDAVKHESKLIGMTLYTKERKPEDKDLPVELNLDALDNRDPLKSRIKNFIRRGG